MDHDDRRVLWARRVAVTMAVIFAAGSVREALAVAVLDHDREFRIALMLVLAAGALGFAAVWRLLRPPACR